MIIGSRHVWEALVRAAHVEGVREDARAVDGELLWWGKPPIAIRGRWWFDGWMEEDVRSSRAVVRWVVAGVITLAVLTVVFHVAGGWYFSGRIESSGLQPQPPSRDYGVQVVSSDSALLVLTGGDAAMFDPGTYSLVWDGGRATMGEIVSHDEDTVTRALLEKRGEPPLTPAEVDIDAWMFDTPLDAGLGYTDIAFRSPLGDMAAWHVPAPDSRTTWAIHIHGWRADRRETLRSLNAFHEAGMDSLVIAYRNDVGAPPDPSGRYRFGRSEWMDVEAAVRYARENGAEQIVLSGFSTGGAIAVAFLLESDLADMVVAVVLDSPNLDFGQVVRAEASQTALIPGLPLKVPVTLTAAAMTIADLRYEIGWSSINYIDHHAPVGVPVLIFHGTEDETVPISVSQRFATVNKESATLVVTEGAAHVRSWNVDPVRYETELSYFLNDLN